MRCPFYGCRGRETFAPARRAKDRGRGASLVMVQRPGQPPPSSDPNRRCPPDGRGPPAASRAPRCCSRRAAGASAAPGTERWPVMPRPRPRTTLTCRPTAGSAKCRGLSCHGCVRVPLESATRPPVRRSAKARHATSTIRFHSKPPPDHRGGGSAMCAPFRRGCDNKFRTLYASVRAWTPRQRQNMGLPRIR
jgi:hypothetical protein